MRASTPDAKIAPMNLIKKFNEWRAKQDAYLIVEKWENWASKWMPYIFIIAIGMIGSAVIRYML